MANGTCINCDEHGEIHQHHPDKKKWPDFTVPLCPRCHYKTHNFPVVFIRPGAHEEYNKWLEEQKAKRKYVPLKEAIAKYKEVELDEHGQHRWW